jgi:acetyl esterase
MPLDPQAQVILDQMAALGLGALGTMSAEETRRQLQESGRALPPGQPVKNVEDRAIPGPAGDIPVRIYTPDGDPPLPLLVYYHGGGWVLGNLDQVDATCRELANAAGCVVVSVDYRLAPEHTYPAAAEDSYAAFRWVADNASALGGDSRRIAMGGDSAGGNLAAVVCLMAKERGGPSPSFQALVYPVTDHSFETASYRDNAEGYLLTTTAMRWFWDQYLNEPGEGRQPYASPLRAEDLSGLPPALIITAEFDPLRDEGEAYGERLRQAGVPVVVSRYDGMIHGFFGMSLIVDKAKLAVGEVTGALKSAFAAQPV